jgi:transcription elongation factor
VVKIIGGKYKGRKGVIKYINKNILFLWDKEFIQSNGIFVENTSNVLILGDEHMKQNDAGAVASMNRRIKDSIIGKEVLIVKGEWKGYRGRVCRADDKQAIVELSSKCKQIPIERSLIKEIEDENKHTTRDDISYGGQTIYEAGKTPMQYNTPSYYPHSPHWGAG